MVLAPNTYQSVQFVTAAVHNVPGGESGLVVRLHPCREGTSEPEPVRVGCMGGEKGHVESLAASGAVVAAQPC